MILAVLDYLRPGHVSEDARDLVGHARTAAEVRVAVGPDPLSPEALRRVLAGRGKAKYRVVAYVTGRVVDLDSPGQTAVGELEEGDTLVELRLATSADLPEAWAAAHLRRDRAVLVGGRRDDAGKLVGGAKAGRVLARTADLAKALGIGVVLPGMYGGAR